MLHDIFEKAIRANNYTDEFLRACTEEILSSYVEKLYGLQSCLLSNRHSIGETDIKARRELQNYMPTLKQWGKKFIGAQPKPDVPYAVQKRLQFQAAINFDDRNATTPVCITKVLGVEESIWSPMYGLKGNFQSIGLRWVQANWTPPWKYR